jgi:flavodoxin
MKAAVIYESLYGNTEAIAKAVAEGVGHAGEVEIVEVSQAPEAVAQGFDLLVLGAPTHGHGMSRPESRESVDPAKTSMGIREWLERLSAAPGARVAAFDTRFDKPRWLTGSAALKISRRLSDLGCELVMPPESFFVDHTEGPLQDGELDRAKRWGAGWPGS